MGWKQKLGGWFKRNWKNLAWKAYLGYKARKDKKNAEKR